MTEFMPADAGAASRFELAMNISRLAGEVLLELQPRLEVGRKPDRTLVTNADRQINSMYIEAIRADFPDDLVLGEEETYTPTRIGEYRWVIDPIDGTSDYVRGGDSNGIATALLLGDIVLFGTFYNPSKQEFFTAQRGSGALLNGAPLQVNQSAYEAGIAYDYCHWKGAAVDTRVFETILGPPLGQYSVSNQACRVAQGVSTFTAFPGALPHDILPGAIIVEEAGGRVTDLQGLPLTVSASRLNGAVYSNGISHDAVVSTLQQ